MWIKISTLDDLPKKPGLRTYEQIDCLIVYEGRVLRRMWNCEHRVWDDQDGDDFFCDPLAATYYMPIPALPRDLGLPSVPVPGADRT